MNGVTMSFSDADLAATAAAYNPALHEAPLVCGHPAHDDPAHGWAQGLQFNDGALEAIPTQVNPAFAEMVASGAFKKISASFYAPDAPSNPVPGVYYLRHIGFLGAAAPAVKGMRNPSFADTEVGVLDFSEYDDVDNASLWRALRDWMIGKFSQDEADKVLPARTVQALEQSAQDELRESRTEAYPTPAFTDPQGEPTVTPEQKAALEAENAALKAQIASFTEAQATAALTARHAAHIAFADGLIAQGKLLPAQKSAAVATLDFIGADSTVEFGEGDAKAPLIDALKGLLNAAPVAVAFGEAMSAETPAKQTKFEAPAGYQADAAQLETLNKIHSYAEQHGCDFSTAATQFNQGA